MGYIFTPYVFDFVVVLLHQVFILLAYAVADIVPYLADRIFTRAVDQAFFRGIYYILPVNSRYDDLLAGIGAKLFNPFAARVVLHNVCCPFGDAFRNTAHNALALGDGL